MVSESKTTLTATSSCCFLYSFASAIRLYSISLHRLSVELLNVGLKTKITVHFMQFVQYAGYLNMIQAGC